MAFGPILGLLRSKFSKKFPTVVGSFTKNDIKIHKIGTAAPIDPKYAEFDHLAVNTEILRISKKRKFDTFSFLQFFSQKHGEICM